MQQGGGGKMSVLNSSFCRNSAGGDNELDGDMPLSIPMWTNICCLVARLRVTLVRACCAWVHCDGLIEVNRKERSCRVWPYRGVGRGWGQLDNVINLTSSLGPCDA